MLIIDAELEGRACCVRIEGERISGIAADLEPRRGEVVLPAAGGALIPGLHDHHIHLFALAADARSVRCGPPDVQSVDALARALSGAGPAAPGGWIRGVGYHESVAGALDRDRLDAWIPDRPARIQHRSGAMWMLNSIGVAQLGLDAGMDRPGIERDAQGRATGRLFDLDAWLRDAIGDARLPDLAPVGEQLARFGVTGVTDASASNASGEWDAFAAAIGCGALRQRVVAMGRAELVQRAGPVSLGALKILLSERALMDFDDLVETIRDAHARDRAVAIHCVTRAELVFATAAFERAGPCAGDRIEHASIATPDALERLGRTPISVVTQPAFLYERGDAYLVDVDPDERAHLYRGVGFVRAGVPLGGGSDAPYGSADPWRAIAAAVERRTRAGVPIGEPEGLSPERALALFTTPPTAPGGAPRRVAVGADADLCLLDRSWERARRVLDCELVAATVCRGALTYRAR